MCGLQIINRILIGPTGIRCALLQGDHQIHSTQHRLLDILHAECLVALGQEVDNIGHHIVIQGDKRRVVSLPVEGVIIAQRITLRPATHRILALEHKVNHLLQCRAILRIVLLDIHAQQEGSRLHRTTIVVGGITIVVLELLQSPTGLTDGCIPLFERIFTGKVEDIVPAATFELSPDQRSGHTLGLGIIILIARSVVSIKQQMAHRRRSGRLNPDHRPFGLHLAPLTRHVGQIVPHKTAIVAHLVHHKAGCLTHLGQHLLLKRLFGSGKGRQCTRRTQHEQSPSFQ